MKFSSLLAGDENFIKADRMTERFVENCIKKKLSTNELIQLFSNVIKDLKSDFPNLTLRELDHEIWKYQSDS
jgi:BarA-like signal transduction histidine kinase